MSFFGTFFNSIPVAAIFPSFWEMGISQFVVMKKRLKFSRIKRFFRDVSEFLLIPYARPSGLDYASLEALRIKDFAKMGYGLRSIHHESSLEKAIGQTGGIFVCDGNTHLLLQQLNKQGLLDPIRSAVQAGIPYLGVSAGAILAGYDIRTTNDPEIVRLDTKEALGLFPYNLNPHYPFAINQAELKLERRKRLSEFVLANKVPVIALPEGGLVKILDEDIYAGGENGVLVFGMLHDGAPEVFHYCKEEILQPASIYPGNRGYQSYDFDFFTEG